MNLCRVGRSRNEKDDAAQLHLTLGDESPAASWTRDAASHVLDELFTLTSQYQSSAAYHDLLLFVGSFRFYAPFNAMLVHAQMPGAVYVATPSAWLRDYKRRVKADARPLVILRPKGPVMFVFDVSNTDPEEGAPPLPREVLQPFEVRHGKIGPELDRTVANARRDGVDIVQREDGSQSAGEIRQAQAGRRLSVLVKEYCGHLGTPNDQWWPDRRGLPHAIRELEAESVCYLVCARAGIDNPSDEYLATHLKDGKTPSISLECVMKAAGLIEQMGRERLKPRKENGS